MQRFALMKRLDWFIDTGINEDQSGTQSKNRSLQNIKADVDQHLVNSIDFMLVNRLVEFQSVHVRGGLFCSASSTSFDSPVHLVPSHDVFLFQRLDGVQLPRLLKLRQ